MSWKAKLLSVLESVSDKVLILDVGNFIYDSFYTCDPSNKFILCCQVGSLTEFNAILEQCDIHDVVIVGEYIRLPVADVFGREDKIGRRAALTHKAVKLLSTRHVNTILPDADMV